MMMMDWAQTVKPLAGAKPGLYVNVPSKADLLADLRAHFEERRGFCVATLNLDHVVQIRNNSEFYKFYQQHSHITADGNPIVWLSRLARQDVHLVPGSELIEPLVEIAAQTDTPIALFGATQESLDRSAEVLKQRYPEAQIVARIAPQMGFDPMNDAAQTHIDTLEQSGARLCFLALGAPRQEMFAIRLNAQVPQMGVLSIGAGLDFISGAQTRAPKLMRVFAAEWIWRLASNPGRLARRYGACIKILPGLFWGALQCRYQKNTQAVK